MHTGITGIYMTYANPRYDIASLITLDNDSWDDAATWPEPVPRHDLDSLSNYRAYPRDVICITD